MNDDACDVPWQAAAMVEGSHTPVVAAAAAQQARGPSSSTRWWRRRSMGWCLVWRGVGKKARPLLALDGEGSVCPSFYFYLWAERNGTERSLQSPDGRRPETEGEEYFKKCHTFKRTWFCVIHFCDLNVNFNWAFCNRFREKLPMNINECNLPMAGIQFDCILSF